MFESIIVLLASLYFGCFDLKLVYFVFVIVTQFIEKAVAIFSLFLVSTAYANVVAAMKHIFQT